MVIDSWCFESPTASSRKPLGASGGRTAGEKLTDEMKYFLIILTIVSLQTFSQTNSEFTLNDTCQWDRISTRSRKYLTDKTGIVHYRFGETIININHKPYKPCNLPEGLDGKKVLISAIRYKKFGGKLIKLTSLKILTN